jgi:PAS domain S-box-containing protein
MARHNESTLSFDWYRSLFERSLDAILIMEDNRFLDCNEAACRMLGADSKAAILELEPWQISPETQPDGTPSITKQKQHIATTIEQGTHQFEWEHVKLDGTRFPVEVVLTLLSRDSHTYLHTSLRDLSEHKRLESELRHAQKMEAIGKLVGGVAHDFNNQLMPILGYSEILRAHLKDSPELLEYISWINKAASHSAELVKRLMAFSRKDSDEQGISDLNDVVCQLTEMLHQLIGEDVVLEIEPADGPLYVRLSPGDIEQIVLNLTSNARDAIQRGGRIKLSIIRYETSSESEAMLTVQDNGCGMDRETLNQVFEPLFTTKGLGSGTGLGLASVYNLVKQAGGSVGVDSALGSGSVFRISLPLVDNIDETDPDNLSPSAMAADSSPRVAADRKLLVVEDDDAAGALLLNALTEAGFQVILKGSGQSALRALDQDQFDLMISDVIMPDMSGPALVREVRAREIQVPVLFMSGYTDNRLTAHDIDTATIPLLRKPFTPSELIERVWQAVEDAP